MQILKDTLPNNSFDPLIEMLEKLRDFAHLAVSSRCHFSYTGPIGNLLTMLLCSFWQDIMTQKGKDRVQRVLQIFKLYKQNL